MPHEALRSYDEVHVLLLGWDHDEDDRSGNAAMRGGLEKLDFVFKGFFGFKTYSSWRIPENSPTEALNARLGEFRNAHNKHRNLMIIYYAGHGATDGNRRLLWLPTL